jgi:hypothetical protein
VQETNRQLVGNAEQQINDGDRHDGARDHQQQIERNAHDALRVTRQCGRAKLDKGQQYREQQTDFEHGVELCEGVLS